MEMVGEYRRLELNNGLRVLAVCNPAVHAFVCSLYVRAGPRYEPPERTGLTHLLEHMLLKGSEHFPDAHSVLRSVEEIGGVVDAATHAQYVNVSFAAHRKHWRRLLEVASDVLLRPRLDAADLEHEKRVVAQEMAEHRDSRGRNISAAELVYTLVFRGDLDELGTLGSPTLLAEFDHQMLREHYERFFAARNGVLCLAGGFEMQAVLDRVQRTFGAMKAGTPAPEPLPVPRNSGRRRLLRVTEALPISDAAVAYRTVAASHPMFDAVRAVNHMLGSGLSSRLFLSVRERLGLVYDVYSHLRGFTDTGLLEVALAADRANLPAAVAAALDVVEQVARDGFRPEELERYKETVRCGMDMLCDSAFQLADWYGRQELLLGPAAVSTPQEYIQRQEALSLDQVNQVAAQMFDGSDGLLVAVGPFGEEEASRLRDLFPAEEVC